MKYIILTTSDGRFLGREFEDNFPIMLGDYKFLPDFAPILISDKIWRFYNSNYSIDAKEA